MKDIDRLDQAFPARAGQPPAAGQPTQGTTGDYQDKLRRLGGRWTALINTVGTAESYTSASEVDMAIVAALVKRNFTDGEIWETLRSSPRYQDRVSRKGQQHTDNLYTREIEKCRAAVIPFAPDPPRQGTSGQQHRSRHANARRHLSAVRDPKGAPAPVPLRQARAEPPPFTVVTPPGSFVTRYIDYASQRTDAPPEAHELMAVGALSSLAGSSPRIPMATAVHGWRLNLWTLYIVNSTVGRKSTVINFVGDILTEVLGRDAFIHWESSPQGFIQKLMERDGKPAVFMRDEYSGLMQQMNRGGHMSGLIQTLIRAYDGGVLENVRVKKRDEAGEMQADTDRVLDPYLTTLAASTRDSFIQRATIDNVLDGFLARFVIVTGHAAPRKMATMTPALRQQRLQLIDQARAFAQRADGIAEMGIAPAVLDAAWEIEQAWIAEAGESDYPDALSASFKRLSESVLKVAALLAIDADALTIEPAHYQTACRMGERWTASTRAIIETLGATDFLRHCDAVKDTVRRHPGIALSQLYRHHRRLRKRDFDEVLAALEEQDEIERVEVRVEDGPGRPAVCVYLSTDLPPPEVGET